MDVRATRVLVIEDNPLDASLIARTLAEAPGCSFVSEDAGDLSTGLRRLERGDVDLVLLDLNLPDSEGLEGLMRLQAEWPQIPVVVLTGLGDDVHAARAVRAGAQDYLVKGETDNKLLIRAMRYAIERKRAEEELRQSKELFEKTFASQRDAIFILDAGSPPSVLDCNPVATEMFGYSRQEMVGRDVDFLHADFAALHKFQEHLYPSVEEQGFLYLSDFTMRRCDGSVFPTEHTVAPLEDEKGQRIGWVSVVRDITDRKLMEEALRQHERLAAVGQLAAGIAHDFNNILTSVIGFAEVLQRRSDVSDTAKQYLRPIVDGGRRAALLVRQILDFSRKSFFLLEPLDLGSFLPETARFLERTIPESVHICLEISEGEHFVSADPGQMQQVLTNLALNARDAMAEGGQLSIRLRPLVLEPGEPPPASGMLPGEWILLSVSDTGTGISEDVLPHIYEPFFTTKEVGEGTGLGLAQVYGIVKQHEGFIEVETAEGEGTTFSIYLPALRAQETRDSATPGGTASGMRGGQVILLVEDDPEVLGVGKALLEHLGYAVLTAPTGREALELYDGHQAEIGLVLLDMVMPEMGGLELFDELKARDSEVRVVLVTGYPLGEQGDLLLQRGILDWVQKPLDLNRLSETVSRALDEAAAR
jgi:PAS domain S-box-containing protein